MNINLLFLQVWNYKLSYRQAYHILWVALLLYAGFAQWKYQSLLTDYQILLADYQSRFSIELCTRKHNAACHK